MSENAYNLFSLFTVHLVVHLRYIDRFFSPQHVYSMTHLCLSSIVANEKPSALWYISIIPALGRLRQEDCKFVTRLGYIARPCLQKNKTKQTRINLLSVQLALLRRQLSLFWVRRLSWLFAFCPVSGWNLILTVLFSTWHVFSTWGLFWILKKISAVIS
jgi:hypothetical protein